MELALMLRPSALDAVRRHTAQIAEPELRASPARPEGYLPAEIDGDAPLEGLAYLAATSEAFEHPEELAGRKGPLLRPLDQSAAQRARPPRRRVIKLHDVVVAVKR
jgi:hypothetical protein